MSGHSKWATIKHKKGAADKARGKLFAKLIKQVEVAARQGGSDLDSNPQLRTMFQKARDNSVPLDTIERAVKRGTGELEGVTYEVINYEGYAPGGVALFVECLSDNRNRTGSEIKSLFSKAGGSMAEPGAVAWQFERTGIVTVEGADEDDLMMAALEAGASDVKSEGETFTVLCDPTDTMTVRDALEAGGYKVTGADLTMIASSEVLVSDLADANAAVRVMEALDDHDDVQEVYSNADFPEDILASLSE